LTDWVAFLGRHKGLKLLSLLLAVALWFAVGGEERTEVTLSMALEFANIPPHLMVTSEVPPSLQVRVMGPQGLVRKLSQGRLTYALDLTGLKSGRHSFPLGPASFSFPRGVVVTRIQPSFVNLTLAPTITRTLPIMPVLEGAPPEGYEVTEIKTRPAQITVTGPATEFAGLKAIPTLPLDVSNLSAPATLTTDVDFKNLHLTPREQVPVLADITVEPKRITRTISGIPVVANPRPAHLSPSQVTLTLQGPGQQLRDLKASDLKARVDTRNLARGRQRLKVSVDLPPPLRLLKVQPDTLTVWAAKSP
jgi:YbbR domain-containing protein